MEADTHSSHRGANTWIKQALLALNPSTKARGSYQSCAFNIEIRWASVVFDITASRVVVIQHGRLIWRLSASISDTCQACIPAFSSTSSQTGSGDPNRVFHNCMFRESPIVFATQAGFSVILANTLRLTSPYHCTFLNWPLGSSRAPIISSLHPCREHCSHRGSGHNDLEGA